MLGGSSNDVDAILINMKCHDLPLLYERDMFLAMANPVLETIFILWDATYDDQLIKR